jgi:hypothetical protein
MMGQQQNLHQMYDDPETAVAPEGVAAGDDALSVIFGSPDVSQAVVDQAQKFSGVSSGILKKMLPVLAGILISGLMRSRSTGMSTAPSSPSPSGGNLGDILGQIFRRGMPGSAGAPVGPGQQSPPPPDNQPAPIPSGAGEQSAPDGDLLGPILREMEKGIREGRIKPVIIGGGPYRYPYRADNKDRHPLVPTHHRCRGVISLAKFYAISLAERRVALHKCRKGDKDSHHS